MIKVHNRTKFNDVNISNNAKTAFDSAYHSVKDIYNMKKTKNNSAF